MQFSDDLLKMDTNTVRAVYQLQGKLRPRPVVDLDLASQNLFDPLPREVLNRPTYSKFIKLLDNYEPKVEMSEKVTNDEKTEMNDFLSAIINTPVMKKVQEFLISKGKLQRNADFKQLLDTIWFTTYPRIRNVPGSSGFEHVFVGEIKNNAVAGLHNWIQFYILEQSKLVDYQGFFVHLTLRNPVTLLKYKFSWGRVAKPTSTMFIGTSPEFEMGLYTVCFLMRPDERCPIRLGTKTLSIQTFSLKNHGKTFLGSAFPNLG